MIYSLWERGGGAEGGSPFWPCTVTSAEFINKSNRQKCALAISTCYIHSFMRSFFALINKSGLELYRVR